MSKLIEGLSVEGKTFNEYINSKHNPIIYDDLSRNFYKHFKKFYKECKKGHIINKNPDIILYDESRTIGLEFFEIDSSPIERRNNNKQSSKTKDVLNQIHDEIQSSKKDTVKISKIPKKSLKSYIENYKYAFDKHIKNIDQYKKNLKNIVKNNTTECGFVIHNTSFQPDSVYLEGKTKIVTPLNVSSIFNSLQNENRISYVFYLTKNNKQELLIYFFVLDNTNLKRNVKNKIEFCDECDLIHRQAYAAGMRASLKQKIVNLKYEVIKNETPKG